MNPLVDEIDIVAQMDPNRLAMVSVNQVMTYMNLSKRIRSTQTWLQNNASRLWTVGEYQQRSPNAPSVSNVVMVSAQDPFEFMVCLLASLDSVEYTLPVPPLVSSQTRREMIKRLHVSRVLRHTMTGTGELHRADFPQGSLLDITSGSYGAKKLVVRPMENLADEARAVASRLRLHVSRHVLITTPLAHSFGGGIARAALMAGSTIYVSDKTELPSKLVDLRHLISHVSLGVVTGVPYVFRCLLKDWNSVIPMDLVGYAGGEVVPTSLMEQWKEVTGSELRQEYGLSEGGIVTFADPEDPYESIGRPIPRVRVEVKDEELVVYRQWSPKRYYFRESPDTFQPDGGIRTGDLGYEQGGRFFLTGRKKSVIVVAGMKLVPLEVERVLASHPEIEEAVVLGRPDEIRGEKPVAYVTLTPWAKGHLSITRVRQYMKQRLESYKVPKEYDFHIVSEFPRTVSGKVDRQAIA